MPRACRLLFVPALALGACAPTFYERAVAEPGAAVLPSGAVFRSVKEGDGATPASGTWVRVAYDAKYADCAPLRSSKDHPDGVSFTFDGASPCLHEALARMKVGGEAKIVCTADNVGGTEGPGLAATTVAVDLRLLAVDDHLELPLPEGLVYKIVHEGTGEHPKPSDKVKVNYEGRLADGTVFDSTEDHGPAELPLTSVIECWRDVLPRMRVGEKAVLTCPGDIAYGKAGSPPKIPPDATLTFDIELVGIEH